MPSIYFAHGARCSSATACCSPSSAPLGPTTARSVHREGVRYRTVGDMTCTGAVRSAADDVDEVIAEVAATAITERGATRADDRFSEAAMEDRKREGYF